MQPDRNRPIRSRIVKQLGFTRRPYDEPLTLGLRRQSNAAAIGFTHDFAEQSEWFKDMTATKLVNRSLAHVGKRD